MQYKTRSLEALTDVPMGGAYYTAGQRFDASEVDAEYLIRHKKAKEAGAKSPAAPTPPPVESVRRGPGRPPNATRAAAPPPAESPAPLQPVPARVVGPASVSDTAGAPPGTPEA